MRTALVVGLLPGQTHALKTAVPGWRWRFVSADCARGIKSTSDVNVVMVDYVDHKATQRIAALARPHQEVHHVRGLGKNAIRLLETL